MKLLKTSQISGFFKGIKKKKNNIDVTEINFGHGKFEFDHMHGKFSHEGCKGKTHAQAINLNVVSMIYEMNIRAANFQQQFESLFGRESEGEYGIENMTNSVFNRYRREQADCIETDNAVRSKNRAI